MFWPVRSKRRADTPAPDAVRKSAIPEGMSVYAIGDVHGRIDLLERLMETIRHDLAKRAPQRAILVLLGDLIDRGPHSREVLDLCINAAWSPLEPVFLIGNHEEMMLSALDGNLEAVRFWRRHGGEETLQSYGVPEEVLLQGTVDSVLQDFSARVPARHISFLRGMVDHWSIGDYFFAHAGVRPGCPLDRQTARDLRWIRREFLEYDGDHGAIVVHGHTITDGVEELPNRIGIDTGAYETGVLTAIGLSGNERWYLST